MAKARLAFLAANPRDRHTPLRQMEEYGRLRKALDKSVLRSRVEITEHLTARLEDLVCVLAVEKPEVLLFSGFHASEKGGIVLEDENGSSVPLSTEQLLALLEKHSVQAPRCIFLNTCYTESTARALVRKVDCAIGYQGLVADDFANAFAEAFFTSVFSDQSVSAAFESANRAALADRRGAEAQATIGLPEPTAIHFRPTVARTDFRAFTVRPLSVFISYGGPDQEVAERLHSALEERGIDAFLFTRDATPGKTLHGMMRDGVNEHDWTLVLCSRNSLDRSGVLTEIEESLRKVSRSGGRNAVMPIALDDYVYKEWAPRDAGFALYFRDLVICDFRQGLRSKRAFNENVDRLVAALTQE